MRILFSTNVPSPYRVAFFNELGKFCDLTVCYERKTASDRDDKWKGEGAKNFEEIYLDLIPVGADQSRGKALKEFVKKTHFDALILTNYVSPAVRTTIAYCRSRHIPYWMEYDGGFYKKDKFPKNIVKKFLLCAAEYHFTTCNEHIQYLQSIGIKKEKIYKYPFTSLKEEDIVESIPSQSEKQTLREKLGIIEKKVVLSVGQFIPRKGFDVLLESTRKLSKEVGVYIVGGIPPAEYLNYKNQYQLENVHFINFMDKQSLKQWYKAADCFVLPTREDVWGLVINEAMACGLPVITTEKCIAGLELVQQGANGYIVPIDNSGELTDKIVEILESPERINQMGNKSLEIIKEYTIEKMVDRHLEIFTSIKNIEMGLEELNEHTAY